MLGRIQLGRLINGREYLDFKAVIFGPFYTDDLRKIPVIALFITYLKRCRPSSANF